MINNQDNMTGHGYSILGKPKQGFTCSAFDLLHAGHILMLEEARSQCDYLIVGLQNDPSVDRIEKNKPIQSLVERYLQLKALKNVNEIIVYNTEKDLEDLLLILPIKIRFVGEEYKDKDLTGRETCNKRGIEIYYNKREHTFSTTELRARIARKEIQKTSYSINVDPSRVGTVKWTEP